MKTTFKFIIAAMAAVSVFSSCQKELANETVNNTTGGVRTIAVQFDNSTKATLDGFTPKFEENDAIRVSNNTTSEVCTLSVTGTFTTTLSGELTAIYPADAADFAPGTPDGKITGFKVSTSQNGKLKDAIIAKATIAENSSVATFQGQTAVFRITPGAGNSTKYVEVITAGPEIANTATTEYTKKNKIHVETDNGDEVFVSVLVPAGGLKLRDLSFADGSKMKTVTDATKGATAINSNTIYKITNSGWDRGYVEINGLKWATMNIGATSANEAGKYFMWGYTDGHSVNTTGTTISGTTIKNAFSDQTFKEGERGDDSKGFAWDNYIKFTSSTYSTSSTKVFTKYVPQSKASDYGAEDFYDDKTTLDLADDAANANWGGSWRMPTKAEFDALCALTTKSWKTNYNASGVNGYEFTNANSNSIFLPAASYGWGTDLFNNEGRGGTYWSSSLSTYPYSAYQLGFFDNNTSMNSDNRITGRPVRALSD